MKVGFVFECGPKGADVQVCEYLAMAIRSGIVPVSRTLDNKANLLRDAGRVAAALLADGCERVLIVWDLRPAWPDKKAKPCRHDERAAMLIKPLKTRESPMPRSFWSASSRSWKAGC